MEKYIIGGFQSGGSSNVIIELEVGLALSYITGRTLLIPNLYDRFVLKHDTFHHGFLFDILDKNAISKEFNVKFIDGHSSTNYLDFQYYKKFFDIGDKDCFFLDEFNNQLKLGTCYFNSEKVIDETDFANFISDRPKKDVAASEKFLIYSAMQDVNYCVYPGPAKSRNELKNKIKSAIKFKKKYEYIADAVIDKHLKKFNAIHIRFALFFSPDPKDYVGIKNDIINIKDRPDLLYNQISLLYDKDLPLYISTDIHKTGMYYNPPILVDIDTYLDPIRKEYDVFLIDDFDLQLTSTEEIAVEQLICSKAEKFYGTYGSTFSKRINIQRGYSNRSTTDYMGWNKVQDPWMEVNSPWPWTVLKKAWEWYYSSYLYYTLEEE